ncbi:MAG: hypothetical protein EBU81_02160 [Proteobacteria bacterium]|nr:hypothetical protein [Pseudomonadota bacterium]
MGTIGNEFRTKSRTETQAFDGSHLAPEGIGGFAGREPLGLSRFGGPTGDGGFGGGESAGDAQANEAQGEGAEDGVLECLHVGLLLLLLLVFVVCRSTRHRVAVDGFANRSAVLSKNLRRNSSRPGVGVFRLTGRLPVEARRNA